MPTPQPGKNCKILRKHNPDEHNMTVLVLKEMGDKFELSDLCPPLYSAGGWCKTLTPGTMKRVEAPDQVMFELISFIIRLLTIYFHVL